MKRTAIAAVLLAAIAGIAIPLHADAQQRLRQRIAQMREASRQDRPVDVPAGGKAVRNVAYGPDPAQRLDVYLPAKTSGSRALPVVS